MNLFGGFLCSVKTNLLIGLFPIEIMLVLASDPVNVCTTTADFYLLERSDVPPFIVEFSGMLELTV